MVCIDKTVIVYSNILFSFIAKRIKFPLLFWKKFGCIRRMFTGLDSLDNCADFISVIVRCLSGILEKIFSYLNDASYF